MEAVRKQVVGISTQELEIMKHFWNAFEIKSDMQEICV